MSFHGRLSRPLLATVVGLLMHRLVFIRGEWHLLAPAVVIVHVASALLLIGVEILLSTNTHIGSTRVLVSVTYYLASLFTSIVVYRLCFHRLRCFPGPRLAAVSKLWHVWQCRDSRNHLVLENLRQEYGSFVRTGEEFDLSAGLLRIEGPFSIILTL